MKILYNFFAVMKSRSIAWQVSFSKCYEYVQCLSISRESWWDDTGAGESHGTDWPGHSKIIQMIYTLLRVEFCYPVQTVQKDVKKVRSNFFSFLIMLKKNKTCDSDCAPSMGGGRMVYKDSCEIRGQCTMAMVSKLSI